LSVDNIDTQAHILIHIFLVFFFFCWVLKQNIREIIIQYIYTYFFSLSFWSCLNTFSQCSTTLLTVIHNLLEWVIEIPKHWIQKSPYTNLFEPVKFYSLCQPRRFRTIVLFNDYKTHPDYHHMADIDSHLVKTTEMLQRNAEFWSGLRCMYIEWNRDWEHPHHILKDHPFRPRESATTVNWHCDY
jgi:hypothetical protein